MNKSRNTSSEVQPQTLLAPSRDIQKFFISVSCRLDGRYTNNALLLTDAQPALSNFVQHMRMRREDTSRTALALVFRSNPSDQGDIIIPQYDSSAELVCSVLSLLYGKRFDNHGPIENSGYFYLPNLRALDVDHDWRLPQNGNQQRADYSFPLNLSEVRRILPLLFGQVDPLQYRVLRSAIKFYHQALLAAEQDVEVAYLHLITVGEILSSMIDLNEDSLIDADTRQLLRRIDEGMEDQGAASRQVRGKLRSVRRRFVAALHSLIDKDFFEAGEAQRICDRLDSDSLIRRLAAAYDLRSRYVHTGESFGGWIGPRGATQEEVQSGQPIVDDRKFGRALAAAPTYIGLERLTRYCLLRQLEQSGLDLNVRDATLLKENAKS